MKAKILFIFSIILIFIHISALASPLELKYDGKVLVYTAEPVYLNVEGILVESDMPPVILNDRALVPVRAIFQVLGADIEWDDNKKEVKIEYLGNTITLTINSDYAYINGVISEKMDVPAKIINDRTMIPARFASESLGLSVNFDDNNRIIYVKGATEEKNVANIMSISGELNGTTYRISVESDAEMASYSCFNLENPHRFVIDISGATLTDEKTTLDFAKGYIREIRFSNFDIEKNIVRLVVDLTESCQPEIQMATDKKSIILNFKNLPVYTVQSVSGEVNGNYDKINVKLYGKNVPNVFMLTDPCRIVMDFENEIISDKFSLIEFEGNYVTKIRAAQFNEKTVRVVANLSAETGYNVTYADDTVTLTVGDGEIYVPPNDDSNTQQVPEEDEAIRKPKKSFEEFVVVIDAGHGGTDCGAIGYNEDGSVAVYEKDINLEVANYLIDYLNEYGVKLYATRTTDKFLELSEIYKFANSYDADLFVSIHSNAAESKDAKGTEVLYTDKKDYEGYNTTGKVLAENIQKAVVNASGLYNRGIQVRPNLAVIRGSDMPAVIVETGFVTNKDDREVLTKSEMLKAIAKAVADSIVTTIRESL